MIGHVDVGEADDREDDRTFVPKVVAAECHCLLTFGYLVCILVISLPYQNKYNFCLVWYCLLDAPSETKSIIPGPGIRVLPS